VWREGMGREASGGPGGIWVACVQLLVQHTNSTIGSALPERAVRRALTHPDKLQLPSSQHF
jgi:hypothetical protein